MLSKHLKAWNILQSEKKGRKFLIRQKAAYLFTGENYNALKATSWKENSQVLTKGRAEFQSVPTGLYFSVQERNVRARSELVCKLEPI